MKKLNKKGFTIVELVIVIAVIGILAGVLIPTFTIVVRKANESAATQALDGARKEQMTTVDATADDFADFDDNTFYYYQVDKKGQNIKELQGIYQFVDGEWKQLVEKATTGYEQAYALKKATAYDAGATYYNANDEEQTIADEAAYTAAGTLYVRENYADINGVKIMKKTA